MFAEYADFELIVNEVGDDYTVEARGPNEMSIEPQPLAINLKLALSESRLTQALARLKRGYAPSVKQMEEIGGLLFDALMPPPIRSAYARAQSSLKRDAALRLRLNIRNPKLFALPWELLFDRTQHYFLATRRTQPIVRFLDNPQPVAQLHIDGPPALLLVQAQPFDLPALNLEKSAQALKKTFGLFADIHVLANATAVTLRETLQKKTFHILHYDGHGFFDEIQHRGVLALENEQKRVHPISGQQLANYLSGTQVRLVVLSACQTAQGSMQQRFVGVAQHLMRSCRLPAVVAMQFAIPDHSAIAFNRGFYGALANGSSVDVALADGRMAIQEASGMNTPDWATPLILTRSKEVRLWGQIKKNGQMGEANQRLQEIERLIGESTRVQHVKETRRLFSGVRTLPKHYIPREKEISDLRQMLMNTHQVALTALTGMGGMGKTVLAQALAHDETCTARYPDGVLWGELGPQADEEADADAMLIEWALATGLIERMGDGFYRLPLASKSRLLANHLQQQRLLFIIDDVWHSEPARLLTQVRGPHSGLLLTTRSAKIAQSLHLTDYTINQLQPDEALALLSKRRGQALSAQELPLAQELVQRLGYHPLAVELATAQLSLPRRDWHTFLTPLRQQQGAIGRLALANSRHASLQLCFDLSYDHLSPDAQKAYRWLGVMATEAPFRWQDVQALSHWTKNPLPLFDALLDAALLEEISTDSYRQHLLLREDALRRLSRIERDAALMRHGEIYRDIARQAEEEQDYRPIERDYAQIEAILQRAWRSWQEKTPSSTDGLTYARQDAFELLNNLVMDCELAYWSLQGIYAARLRWLPRAADLAQQMGKIHDQSVHLSHLGLTYFDLGEVKQAIGFHQQALEIGRQIGNKQSQGRELGRLGISYASLGEVEQGINFYQQALEISRQIGDKQGEGICLGYLALAYRNLGKVEQAIKLYQQGLEMSQKIGDKRACCTILGNLGTAYKSLGEVSQAINYNEQALEISRQIGYKRREGIELGKLGSAYCHLGKTKQSISFYEQALSISREIGDKRSEGNHLGSLGVVYANLGKVERAIEHYNQALEISRLIGHRHNEANCLQNLGATYFNLGQMERARALWREALGIYEAVKSPNAEVVRGWLGF